MAAGGTPLLRGRGLPEEIVVWEILIRLPPESLLRCQAVCRAWRLATSTRRFLLAHHARQPALPVFLDSDQIFGVYHHNIRVFDYRVDRDELHTIARLDEAFNLEASCDGLLVFSELDFRAGSWTRRLSFCNPATREHGSLRLPPLNLRIMGMYQHRPTGEYRMLLLQHTRTCMSWPQEQIGCYVFALGSEQPPRFIEEEDTNFSWCFGVPVRVRDSLHWYSHDCPSDNKTIVVFDTIPESFRRMRAPAVSTDEYIFDVDLSLKEQETIDIWVLWNYVSEVWDFKYRIKLPLAAIRCEFQNHGHYNLDVVSKDGDVLVLLLLDRYLIHIDRDGKLLDNFTLGRDNLCMSKCRLKQSLVQHSFFLALEGYSVNASPWLPKPPYLYASDS